MTTSLRTQPTFCLAMTGFPPKWRLRNDSRNSILMTCHYPCLGSANDWLKQISHAARPVRSTSQIWVVTDHQYGISSLVSQTSFQSQGNQYWHHKMSAVFSIELITKEGIKIKRNIDKTVNFNPFTLRPSYDEMIYRQILWCYHSTKTLRQNVSIVLLL